MNECGEFDSRQPLTLDSLQTFLDLYFPKRGRKADWTISLFEELIEYEVELWDVVEHYTRVKHILPEMEAEEIDRVNKLPIEGRGLYVGLEEGEEWKGWAQVGIVRAALELSHDRYWNEKLEDIPIPEEEIEMINRWRKKI